MAGKMNDPEFEKKLIEYESAERQLQMILLQKQQIQMQLNEINLATEELKKAKGDVYKSIGSIMIRSTREDADQDLKEKKELFELRLNTLNKQDEKLKENLSAMQTDLQARMQK
jgi:prefoldin beta subunit